MNKFSSKGFGYGKGKSKAAFAKETDGNIEKVRTSSEDRYYGDASSIEAYIKSKLKMLRSDMYIKPTQEELDKLHSLTSMIAIDNLVHSIIDRHWASF